VRPELLGVIGEDHLRRLSVSLGGEPKSFKYFLSPGHDKDGVPYAVEIATCPFKKWVAGKEATRGRVLITGVNFSATINRSATPISARRCCRISSTSMVRNGTSSMTTAGIS
jgi:hypothetical protein